MRAIDVQGFAGGMTLGVTRAGFELVGKRELPGGFGVPGVLANQRLLVGDRVLDYQEGPWDEWEHDDVELVFGNPPCSAFSQLTSDPRLRGPDAPINDCMRALMDFAARCAPPVIVMESVQAAYKKGHALMMALRERVEAKTGARYDAHHVLHQVAWLGGPTKRRRYFLVLVREGLPFGTEINDAWVGKELTLRDAIGDLEDLNELTMKPQPYNEAADVSAFAAGRLRRDWLVDGHEPVNPGKRLRHALELGMQQGDRDYDTFMRAFKAGVKLDDRLPEGIMGPLRRGAHGAGRHYSRRARYDHPSLVVDGSHSQNTVHPVVDRTLTQREVYRIQGFPDDWRLEDFRAREAVPWPGKGVTVFAGEWVANLVRQALEGNAPPFRGYEIGEREYLHSWSVKPDVAPAELRERLSGGTLVSTATTTTTEEKAVTEEKAPRKRRAAPTLNDPDRIAREFKEVGATSIRLEGLDQDTAKRERELLYQAAYGMGRKVKVRTDRKTKIATGVLLDVDGNLSAMTTDAPEPPPIDAPVQAPAEPASAPQAAPEQPELPLEEQSVEPTHYDEAEEDEECGHDHAGDGLVHVSGREGDVFDKTSLKAGNRGYEVHRDYAAHFFRWSWATSWINNQMSVLDVGCGQDQPLARLTVYASKLPGTLYQVDLNRIPDPQRRKWLRLYDETDFTDVEVQRQLWIDHGGPFDLVVSFEVIEHMIVDKGRELLVGMHRLVNDDGRVIVSTPVFNGRAAKNHIHEYTVPELQSLMEEAGFEVVKRYGTFANYHDAKRGVTEWAQARGQDPQPFLDLYEELLGFHSHDALACFLAPIIPDHARNNVWVLRKATA